MAFIVIEGGDAPDTEGESGSNDTWPGEVQEPEIGGVVKCLKDLATRKGNFGSPAARRRHCVAQTATPAMVRRLHQVAW